MTRIFPPAWPLRTRVPPPEPPPAVIEEFEKFGGDRLFLDWLKLLPSDPKEPFINKTEENHLDRSRRQCHSLRNCLDTPLMLGRFPETRAILPALLDLEVKLALTVDLNQTRRRNIAKRIRLAPARSGHGVERRDLYRWLGVLVPYTASCRSGRRPSPNWAWIDRWLDHLSIPNPYGGSQKYWSKSVSGQWKAGHLKPDLATLLADAAGQYPLYLSVTHEERTPKERRDMASARERYTEAVTRLLPWARPRTTRPR